MSGDPLVVVETVLAALLACATGALLAVRRAQQRFVRTLRMASEVVASTLAAQDGDGLDELPKALAELFRADACALVRRLDDGDLVAEISYGFPPDTDLRIHKGQGLVSVAWDENRSVVIPNVRKEPRYVKWIETVRSLVVLPLHEGGEVAGVLVFESSRRRYRKRDLALLEPLAEQISAALENRELRRAAEQRADRELKIRNELQAISAVVMAGVASATDLDGALHSMIKEISARMGWESLAVVLYGDDDLLHTRAYYGYPLHSTVVAFVPGEGIIGAVALSGTGRLVGDVSQDPDYLDVVSETRSEMCVPLYSGRRVIGVLNAESPRLDAFTESDFRVLNTLARQMAIVIERARLADIEKVALERLREADQLKDDFIATVSHELRTPLTSIKGYAQTLLARSDSLSFEDRASFLEIMVRHCDRLARIVDTLLLVSRMEAGEIGGKPTYIGIAELLRDAIEAAGAEDRTDLEIEQGRGVITDHFRAHHILRNVIENACKYSPAKTPILIRSVMTEEALTIEVLDQGPGVPEDLQEQIFQRFRRASDPGSSVVPGTGLGLYIARRFARDLGGDLTVARADEAPWTGAAFRLTLPLRLDPEIAERVRVGGATD